jgi:RHS repeat-associated protein
LPVIPLGGNTGSLTAWVYPDPLTSDRAPFGRWYFQHSVYARNYGTTENPNWRWLGEWNDNYFIASSNSAIDQTWQYIAMTYDGSLGSNNLKLYVNDSLEAQDNETNDNMNETRAWQIGTHGAGSYDWIGDVDEFRICSETLSADWIKFEYRNMAEADNELTWSAEEEVPQSSPPSTLIGNPYLFTGRRFDLETGLYYYRARYYNPHIGRFLQTDPVGYGDGMNWYNYCGNNPLNYLDPYGLYLDSYDWNGLASNVGAWRGAFADPDENLQFTLWIPLVYVWNYNGYPDSFFTNEQCFIEIDDFLRDTGFFEQFQFQGMILA